jgi:hypothetical protein
MADLGKDYGTSTEVLVPRVTNEMIRKAALVVLSNARDYRDAIHILSMMGITCDQLMEARATG